MQPEKLIFTTMKNEGPFILEWVAYHRSVGIDFFLIFTNDCDDGTDRIAKRLEELGYGVHVPNEVAEGGNPQHQMLRRVRRRPELQAAVWLLCLDVDEFLNISVGEGTLDDFIGAVESRAGGMVDAISLAWRLFGAGGELRFEDAEMTSRFVWADSASTYHSGRASGLKTLFRNNGTFTRFGPHRPKGIPDDRLDYVRWSDAGGRLFPARDVGWRAWSGFSHEFGRINHYSVRSVDSFLVKRDRGRTNHIRVDQAESYWKDMNARICCRS